VIIVIKVLNPAIGVVGMVVRFTVKIGQPYVTYDSKPLEAIITIHIPMDYESKD
jgi:hypothetical protein